MGDLVGGAAEKAVFGLAVAVGAEDDERGVVVRGDGEDSVVDGVVIDSGGLVGNVGAAQWLHPVVLEALSEVLAPVGKALQAEVAVELGGVGAHLDGNDVDGGEGIGETVTSFRAHKRDDVVAAREQPGQRDPPRRRHGPPRRRAARGRTLARSPPPRSAQPRARTPLDRSPTARQLTVGSRTDPNVIHPTVHNTFDVSPMIDRVDDDVRFADPTPREDVS
jgi:hypothetical protein